MNNKLKCCICGFENGKSILSHVRQKHKISAKEYKNKFHSPLRRFWGDPLDKEYFKNLSKNNASMLLGKPSRAKLPSDKWSREYSKCIQCGKTESEHISHGVCKKCYNNNQIKHITMVNNSILIAKGVENKDYVICCICGLPFQSLTSNGHLKMHGIGDKEYREKFPLSKMYCKNTSDSRSMSVSQGRKNLMATRGYLNPPSQRLSKSKEMAKRHATNDFATVSKIEDTVSNYLSLNNYSIAWNDYNGAMSEKIIIRQYLFRDCYCVDLACPYRKIIIEVLGDWWHGWEVVIGNQKKEEQHPKVQNNLRLDINRFRYIEHSGWTLVKIWEHDVKNGNYKNILDLVFPKV